MTGKALLLITLLVLVVLALGACIPGPNPLVNTPTASGTIANFWQGLWNGIIAPITFIISLFNADVNFYEVHNDGIPYNLGFVIGAGILFGGILAPKGRRSY